MGASFMFPDRQSHERHHIDRAARSGYFTAVLHLRRGRRLREEHPTLDATVATARRLAQQGHDRPAAVYAVSPEPGGATIHIANVGPKP